MRACRVLLALAILALLLVWYSMLAGCQLSTREYTYSRITHPDGTTEVKFRAGLTGADTSLGEVLAEIPGGGKLHVDDLSVEDRAAAVSQTQAEIIQKLVDRVSEFP